MKKKKEGPERSGAARAWVQIEDYVGAMIRQRRAPSAPGPAPHGT